MEIRALRESDDRASFRSGDPDLDRFFARYAGQNQFRLHLGVSYVAAVSDRILGYATVAAGQMEAERLTAALRKRLPAYPLPVLRLARLAVDASAQAGGIGKTLLRHVFTLALEMSERYGCIGVVVDAKADAIDYYARFGFSALETAAGQLDARPMPLPMFLPLALIAATSSTTEH